ncbi:hypothetical protein AMELA_G00256450 [Ameiurus melas]|uniref:SLP adapter and CSK-interacting membrane protein n=1 Tax=Ameiurus melas TaxID=219545 RepID=A0A7J5ZRX6_AMEME|nr:hypothetical protein AMELA_G00256450 [Ameiurus melas]
MEFQKFLLLIIGGVFASSLMIVILFIIINKCIGSKVAKYAAASQNGTQSSFQMGSTFKQNGQEDERPPLPPRSQFDTESMSNSYEEMPENPMVEDKTSSLQKPVISNPPETHINFQDDNNSVSESYDDVDRPQSERYSYGDETSLPDYLDLDPPPIENMSDTGSENYDDVDQLHSDNEDYDDVI